MDNGLQKHDLVHEFPEYKDKIHQMKQEHAHFAKLFHEYEDVNHHIQGIESQGVNVSDEQFESMKLRRLKLKDELYQMLKD